MAEVITSYMNQKSSYSIVSAIVLPPYAFCR
jgi:hypothetical protein